MILQYDAFIVVKQQKYKPFPRGLVSFYKPGGVI